MTHHRKARIAASGLSLALALSGCAALPAAGPTTRRVEEGGRTDDASKAAPYVLIDLDRATAIRASTGNMGGAFAGDGLVLPPGRAVGLVGPGDLLKVTMWEPDNTGATVLDRQGLDVNVRVDGDGTASVPYVGRVQVSGRKPGQIESGFRSAMASQGKGLQVSVLVIDDQTNSVVVQGEVARPGRFPVSIGANKLLDLLALAGGARTPNHQSIVRVTRGNATVTRTLSQIVGEGAGDLTLAPGDRVLVTPRNQYFYAFGAVQRPGEQAYDADAIDMSRMLARLEGLDDNKANPKGVFVYRRENAERTRSVMTSVPGRGQDLTQVVYRLDLRDPNGFFVAQNFRIEPNDIVYVSNSPLAEAAKVFQIMAGITQIAAAPRNLGAP